ncbi:MAG: Lar family restriction alleviation protein [Erysipelotrichales bacterium]|nr:Lar family restriction alleviation protein [Erysipelotrichales bacterium]
MSEPKLKPCPFCGGEVRMVIAPLGTRAFICDKCGADVMFYRAERDTKKAAEKWNRRTERSET